MPSKSTKRKITKKVHHRRRRHFLLRREILLLILALAMLGTGFYLKQKIAFYYAMYFNKFEHKELSNTEFEEQRINRIVGQYADKTFGIDMSHYQRKEDIRWDSLSIGNRAVPIEFVVLRATMGNRSADRHFDEFWELAKKNNLVRGAYHFYRADEDPVRQANNFLENVHLEEAIYRPFWILKRFPGENRTKN